MRAEFILIVIWCSAAITHLIAVEDPGTQTPAGITWPAGIWECHGTARLRGQTTSERFWLRLMPSDKTYGRNRILQVVYTPPLPAELGGTHLADAPFWLLDPHARLIAWNDRGSSSQMQPDAGAYVVSRERTPTDHTDMIMDEKRFTVDRGWDRTAAPLLLAMTWRADSVAVAMPCIDLFGDAPLSTIAWNGAQVTLETGATKESWQVQPDAEGRLAKLTDAKGVELVNITQWLATGPTSRPAAPGPAAPEPSLKPIK